MLKKVIALTLVLIVLVFLVIQLFAMKSQHKIETYPYQVDEKFEEFETRTYEPRLFSPHYAIGDKK